jgi:hypothetical protein
VWITKLKQMWIVIIGALLATFIGFVSGFDQNWRNSLTIAIVLFTASLVVEVAVRITSNARVVSKEESKLIDTIRSNERLKKYVQEAVQFTETMITHRLRPDCLFSLYAEWMLSVMNKERVILASHVAGNIKTLNLDEVRIMSREVQKRHRRGGIAVQYCRSGETRFWNTFQEYTLASRENAKNGLPITRIFVFPSRKGIDQLSLKLLAKQMIEDSEFKIEVRIAFSNELYGITIRGDFGVWDEELLCYIETGVDGTEVIGASFCVNPDEVNSHLHTLKSLKEQSQLFSEDLISSLHRL